MPRPMKLYCLYSLEDWRKHEIDGEYIYAVGATYSKTLVGAVKTFKDNHSGSFMVVSGTKAVPVCIDA